MSDENEGVISEAVDQHIADTKSIETLSNDLIEAATAFAQAFATECSDRDMSDVDFRMAVEGRPDGNIKISFGTSTYASGMGDSICFNGYSSPVAVMREIFRRIDSARAYAVPLITHKR